MTLIKKCFFIIVDNLDLYSAFIVINYLLVEISITLICIQEFLIQQSNLEPSIQVQQNIFLFSTTKV